MRRDDVVEDPEVLVGLLARRASCRARPPMTTNASTGAVTTRTISGRESWRDGSHACRSGAAVTRAQRAFSHCKGSTGLTVDPQLEVERRARRPARGPRCRRSGRAPTRHRPWLTRDRAQVAVERERQPAVIDDDELAEAGEAGRRRRPRAVVDRADGLAVGRPDLDAVRATVACRTSAPDCRPKRGHQRPRPASRERRGTA